MAKIELLPAEWSQAAERLLAGAVGSNPSYTLDELRNEVRSGNSMLFAGLIDGLLVGFVVVWFEDFGGGREMVIQAGAALGSNQSALKAFMPKFEMLMKQGRATSMRAHVEDRRLLRAMKSVGFKEAETVVRFGG
ncbi:MAG: hypothetical protein RLW87_08000 [Alphaproteobacteria bacterium]